MSVLPSACPVSVDPGDWWTLSPAVGPTDLVVDTSRPSGPIDLTRYALGQGGLSDQPMISDRVDQIAQLHPQTIHVFLQEYFDLYPAHHQFHWETLDKTLDAIRATGARPIVSLCIKPRVLYPQINDEIVDPTDYAEWEELIFQLVKHCNQDRKYGIEYWILSNEGDIGEPGGVPFRFPTPRVNLCTTNIRRALSPRRSRRQSRWTGAGQ